MKIKFLNIYKKLFIYIYFLIVSLQGAIFPEDCHLKKVIEKRYANHSPAFFETLRKIDALKRQGTLTENFFENRRIYFDDYTEKLNSLKKFSFLTVKGIALYNLFQNIKKDYLLKKFHGEFSGESVLFFNSIYEKEDDFKLKKDNPELDLTKEEIDSVAFVLADILRESEIYKKYAEKKAYYDNKGDGNYNYWKQTGIFCDRYRSDSVVYRKPDRSWYKNYKWSLSLLLVFLSVCIFLKVQK